MNLFNMYTIIMTAIGLVFFFAGTLGLLRFPMFLAASMH